MRPPWRPLSSGAVPLGEGNYWHITRIACSSLHSRLPCSMQPRLCACPSPSACPYSSPCPCWWWCGCCSATTWGLQARCMRRSGSSRSCVASSNSNPPYPCSSSTTTSSGGDGGGCVAGLYWHKHGGCLALTVLPRPQQQHGRLHPCRPCPLPCPCCCARSRCRQCCNGRHLPCRHLPLPLRLCPCLPAPKLHQVRLLVLSHGRGMRIMDMDRQMDRLPRQEGRLGQVLVLRSLLVPLCRQLCLRLGPLGQSIPPRRCCCCCCSMCVLSIQGIQQESYKPCLHRPWPLGLPWPLAWPCCLRTCSLYSCSLLGCRCRCRMLRRRLLCSGRLC